MKMVLKQQEKDRLIDRLKGSKLYYRFVQEWTMPLYPDSPREPTES
jgi:hypothetical protein